MSTSENLWTINQPIELFSHWHEETLKVSDKIWKSLLEKDKVLEMIWDIEYEDIRKVLENGLKHVSPEYILKEISVYYDEVEPKLEEYENSKLYNLCLKWKNMLPSQLSNEIKANESINKEKDLNVKAFMDLSYCKRPPSEILGDRDVYYEFSLINNDEEMAIIKRCLNLYWLSAYAVKEYQLSSYYEIKDISNDDVRKMMLLCVNRWFVPSMVQDYQLYFEYASKYWEDNVARVIDDISKLNGNESYEMLAYICSKIISKKND